MCSILFDIISVENLRFLGKHRGIFLHNAWPVFRDNAKSICWRLIHTIVHI